MEFSDIFEEYYALYRAESDAPANDDEEYLVAVKYANKAIRRWANYDATYWKELFTTLQSTDGGSITSGTNEYSAPDDMREAGGFVKILDTNGNAVRHYPILEPQEVQFKGDNSMYAYFTGDPNNGFTLHLNPTPDDAIDGFDIDYVYYRKPVEIEEDSTLPEMADPSFITDFMLAQRFRASRNWTGYQTAKADAENALKEMKMDNDSGSWANPWKVADNSGSQWGA